MVHAYICGWFLWGASWFLVRSTCATSQILFPPFCSTPTTWQSLGPFPVGSREGPVLPPFQLRKSTEHLHKSPLADGGKVPWRDVEEDSEGWVFVRDESIRWQQLRSTSGWSVLQHEVVYLRSLEIIKDGIYSFDLQAAAEFSLQPTNSSLDSRRHYHGDMYSYGTAPRLIDLKSGSYDLIVSYVHDIRIAGEPALDGVPTGRWRLLIEQALDMVQLDPSKAILPDIVNGFLMGSIAGVQFTNVFSHPLQIIAASSKEIGVSLIANITMAPFQTGMVALKLADNSRANPKRDDRSSFAIQVTLHFQTESGIHLATSVRLDLVPHLSNVGQTPKAIKSTFLSNTLSPTYAMYSAPASNGHISSNAILALHGAGVDPAQSKEWTSSIPVQAKEWIVWPLGLTPWGYDWHGGSLIDVNAAIEHLDYVKQLWNLAHNATLDCPAPKDDLKLVVIGHSNGGQGAWYFMSHYPDRVIGGVPASGYVKIQDYVPYHLSVGLHYRDPALTGILTSSLAQFDNDLHASNLAGLPILCRHGGDDDNVPVRHSRQMIDIVDVWSTGSWSDGEAFAQLSEVPSALHWFDQVFKATIVQKFLKGLLVPDKKKIRDSLKFTITAANPDETGSKHGFRVVSVGTPGRLARVSIGIFKTLEGQVIAEVQSAVNVQSISIAASGIFGLFGANITALVFRKQEIPLHPSQDGLSVFHLTDQRIHLQGKSDLANGRRYGPMLSILSSPYPLTIVFGTIGTSQNISQLTETASRISHDAYVYGHLNTRILNDTEWARLDEKEKQGNVVLLGGSWTNGVVGEMESGPWKTPVSFISPSAFSVNSRVFNEAGLGLLFLTEHPHNKRSLALVLCGTDSIGIESATRLFPVRTGTPIPDWVVTSTEPSSGGIIAAGYWGAAWGFEPSSSYLV